MLNTTVNEIKKKYSGSLLGKSWVVLYPLIFLMIYSLVYAFVFKVRYPGLTTPEYVAVIFSGLIIFLGFNEAISSGVFSVVANSGLIKNTMYPIEMIPVRTVFSSQITQLVGTAMLLIMMVFLGKYTVFTSLFIVIWLLEIMMEIGLVWILSSVNVVLRDLQNIVGLVMLMIMMGSPIAYPVSFIPEHIKPFMILNPVYCFIIANQQVLVHGVLPDFNIILGMLVWSSLSFIIGFKFFKKMKRVFIDNV